MAWAKVQAPDGTIFRALKGSSRLELSLILAGAPQVVFSNAINKAKLGRKVKDDIDKLGSKGYRCIGTAYGGKKGLCDIHFIWT